MQPTLELLHIVLINRPLNVKQFCSTATVEGVYIFGTVELFEGKQNFQPRTRFLPLRCQVLVSVYIDVAKIQTWPETFFQKLKHSFIHARAKPCLRHVPGPRVKHEIGPREAKVCFNS